MRARPGKGPARLTSVEGARSNNAVATLARRLRTAASSPTPAGCARSTSRAMRRRAVAPLRFGAGLHGGHGPSSRLACERG